MDGWLDGRADGRMHGSKWWVGRWIEEEMDE